MSLSIDVHIPFNQLHYGVFPSKHYGCITFKQPRCDESGGRGKFSIKETSGVLGEVSTLDDDLLRDVFCRQF